MRMIDTQAGDNSEGKMWGLEGNNLLIVVAGFAVGVTVAIWMFTFQGAPPLWALFYGTTPSILGILYVFTLREGKPKGFDKDLLETQICGRSWKSQPSQKAPPLLAFCLSLILPVSLHGQFIPSQYTDVENNKNYEFTLIRDEPFGVYVGAIVLWTANSTLHVARVYLNDKEVLLHRSSNGDTGTGQQTGHIARLVKGPLKAGTKIQLKGIVECPGDPTGRLFALSLSAVSYDAAVNLQALEQKVISLEASLQSKINQNTNKISEISDELGKLKKKLSKLRQQLAALQLDHSQFKTDTVGRLDALDKRISSLEKDLNGKIFGLSQQVNNLKLDYHQFKAKTAARFDAVDKNFLSHKRRISALEARRQDHTLGILGTSLGGTATLFGGSLLYQSISEHAALHEQFEGMEDAL